MDVAIIKYNAGNIRSVDFALQRMGVNAEITGDFEKIKKADKVIFPGVGEASTTMQYLKENQLDKLLKELMQPVLGICLGLQLMCRHSEENDVDCIGIFDTNVVKFEPRPEDRFELKVPHMGWNNLYDVGNEIFDSSINGQYVYFVHSYYAEICEETAAKSNYIKPFSASLHKGNFYATQFHPEKSGPIGAKILQNFIEL